jgi:hypothetical protein
MWKKAIYCNVFGRLETPFGLVNGSINHLQVVTTINYNTVTHLQSLHANLFNLFAAVFMYSVSLNHTLQIKPSINTLHLHRQTPCILLYSWFQFASQIYDRHECRCIHLENCPRTAWVAPDIFKKTPRYGPQRKHIFPILLGRSVYWTIAQQRSSRWLHRKSVTCSLPLLRNLSTDCLPPMPSYTRYNM